MANLLAGKYQACRTAQGSGERRIGIAGLPKAPRPCHDQQSIQGSDHARVFDRGRRLMADDPAPPSSEGIPGAGREALMVWVKFLGLIAGLALFCLVVFRLTRMLA